MRPPRPILASLALAIATWAGAGIEPEPIVATEHDGLVLSAATRYELAPDDRVVRVTVDAAVTNVRPDSASEIFYYTAINLPAPPGIQAVGAQSGGVAIGTSIVESTEEYSQVQVTFGQGVFHGQTYSFRLAFEMPERDAEPPIQVRVGSSFAAFPVWAMGDPGTPSSVEVAIPAPYEASLLAGELEPTETADGIVLSASDIPDPFEFFAYVTAEQGGARERREVRLEIGSRTARLELSAWDDDPGWLERVEPLLVDGLPALSEAIGLDYPILGVLRVSEHAHGWLGDYAGAFDPGSDEIAIRYDADAFVTLHEAAHIWFSGELFADRWIDEAFASYYAETVGEAIGYEIAAFDLTPDLDEWAFALNDWGEPHIEELEREDYAYAASLAVAREIAALAGDEGLREVWRAAFDRQLAYQPQHTDEVERGVPSTTRSWMRLLDLLEERTGVEYGPIWVEWIATDAQRTQLVERGDARDAYRELLATSGAWELPGELRLAMDGWRFEEAEETMTAAHAVLVERDRIAERAADLELVPPGMLREALETEGTDAAADEAASQLDALDALASADAQLRAELAPVEVVGLIGEPAPELALGAARDAYEAGDAEAAADQARGADAARRAAAEQGTQRVAIGGGALLALDGAAMAALLIRRRRAHRPPSPPPSPQAPA
jgi:hypothetical protein